VKLATPVFLINSPTPEIGRLKRPVTIEISELVLASPCGEI
jgi:hypothetical protein